MHNHQIYQMRTVELPPELAAKLFPFVNAYRPHDPAPTRAELLDSGLERIEDESFVDELNDAYFAEHGYYPDEHPDLVAN